jgi:hypothetical protein
VRVSLADVTVLLGGEASPIGRCVHYLDADPETVLDALKDLHSENPLSVAPARPYPAVLDALPPFEAPWTRELVMACGSGTAYLNNFSNGGDASAAGPALARSLNVRCVMAEHAPRYGPGHASTQMWVIGPNGEPPLMFERTLSAVATDGRWEWHASGMPLAFEDQSRHSLRRIRDRFDRALLLMYLRELDIPADDDAYGPGVVLQQVVDWPRRTITLEEARRS